MKSKEKKNNNIVVILVAILIILILTVIGIIIAVNILGREKLDDTTSNNNEQEDIYNFNQEVVENKEVNGITFTDINCYWDGTNSIISYIITNTTPETVNLGQYRIEAYDDTDTLIYSLSPYAGKDLAPNEEYEELISVSYDLSNAYSIKIFLD